MRLTFAALALVLAAPAALAQSNNPFQNGAAFNNMSAADAARLNHAVQNDTRARQALDQVEQKLKDSGHSSGALLEKTRP
jgi:hypothetical protein